VTAAQSSSVGEKEREAQEGLQSERKILMALVWVIQHKREMRERYKQCEKGAKR
jgi:hypothetical protein